MPMVSGFAGTTRPANTPERYACMSACPVVDQGSGGTPRHDNNPQCTSPCTERPQKGGSSRRRLRAQIRCCHHRRVWVLGKTAAWQMSCHCISFPLNAITTATAAKATEKPSPLQKPPHRAQRSTVVISIINDNQHSKLTQSS